MHFSGTNWKLADGVKSETSPHNFLFNVNENNFTVGISDGVPQVDDDEVSPLVVDPCEGVDLVSAPVEGRALERAVQEALILRAESAQAAEEAEVAHRGQRFGLDSQGQGLVGVGEGARVDREPGRGRAVDAKQKLEA